MTHNKTFQKVAIVYDWIDSWGGVERLLLTLQEIFPLAHFYTSYADTNQAKWAQSLDIRTSFIQKLPSFIKSNRILSLPLFPYAFESFDFTGYDLVISVTSAFAKGVITKPGTKHICYLLTPPRYLWGMDDVYIQGTIKKTLAAPLVKQLKEWDYIAAARPDKIISLSHAVADRCQKYYHRDSKVLHPPFDINYWTDLKKSLPKAQVQHTPDKKGYYLVVSRLEPYKRIDLVIDVFNRQPNKHLLIVGHGKSKEALQKRAKQNISFRENISDRELVQLYSQAQGLIMPQEEDFGYVALEAQLMGCPIIAYKKGGALETIVDKKTGIFFDEQTETSLQYALERFDKISYNLRSSAASSAQRLQSFSKEVFITQFYKYL